jgi:hypothetical protein
MKFYPSSSRQVKHVLAIFTKGFEAVILASATSLILRPGRGWRITFLNFYTPM